MAVGIPTLEGIFNLIFKITDDCLIVTDGTGKIKLTAGNLEKYGFPPHIIGDQLKKYSHLIEELSPLIKEYETDNLKILLISKRWENSKDGISSLVLENIEAGVLVLDSNNNLVFSNNTAKSLFGELKGEIKARLLETAKREGEKEEIKLQENKIIGITAYKIEEQGRLYTVFLLKDITEIKQMEEAVFRLDKISSIGSLALGLAHEIKNALTGMKLLVDSLMKDESGKKLQKLERLASLIERINRTIKSLVSYTRNKSFKLEPLKIKKIIDEVLSLLEEKAENKDIEFKIELDEKTSVLGDREALLHVFTNLILNAIEAIEKRGEIRIMEKKLRKKSLRSKYTAIIIEDTGKGIPEEDVEKIFLPFYTTKKGGMGLGLFVVARLIREMGGYYEIESKAGRGTKFTVFLKKP